MPELDGLQATQQIRQLEEFAAHSRAAEPEAWARSRSDASTCSEASIRSTQSARRVPIIAVSACSETDQLLSPALANVDVSVGIPRSRGSGSAVHVFAVRANIVAQICRGGKV